MRWLGIVETALLPESPGREYYSYFISIPWRRGLLNNRQAQATYQPHSPGVIGPQRQGN